MPGRTVQVAHPSISIVRTLELGLRYQRSTSPAPTILSAPNQGTKVAVNILKGEPVVAVSDRHFHKMHSPPVVEGLVKELF